MKKKAFLLTFCSILCIAGCVDFLGDFNRVEHDKVRVLDFIYDPPEASPGDTVKLTAVFAGLPIDSSVIDWQISFNLGGNVWTVDTAYDIQPLNYTKVDTQFSKNTFTSSLKFVVPDDVIIQSSMIPDRWIDVIPEELHHNIPDLLKSMSKATMIGYIESFKKDTVPQEIQLIMPVIMQLMSIKIRLFANANGLRVRSDYGVRYNSAFSSLPTVKTNTNPTIQWTGIYKVKGEGLQSFDPAIHTQSYELFSLYSYKDSTPSDTVVIDKGYSYFVAAESGNFDSIPSFDFKTNSVKKDYETHFFNWFFMFDKTEQAGIPQNHLPNVEQVMDAKTEIFIPSLDANIKHFTMWVNVYDYYIKERLRPEGSALKEVNGVFSYTQEYIDHAKKEKEKN
ncbi:MAG: hypothetical protein PVI26_02325 [Chitinispirillia bacterium]|jgi:hypothetical protein